MAVLARPDLIGAMLGHLRSISEITSDVSSAAGWKDGRTEPRISGTRQKLWKLPTKAVRLKRSAGPIRGQDFSMGLWTPRVDVFCYGQDERLAGALADIVMPALCVLQGQTAGFTVNGCRIGSIEPEADVNVDLEPDTDFPVAWFPLIVSLLGVPV